MNKNTIEVVKVTGSLVSKLEDMREGEVPKGFQRKLRPDHVRALAKAFLDGSVAPPVLVAKIGNRLVLIDGQHRIHAWLKNEFPLYAQIVEMTLPEASDIFCASARGLRIPRRHILKVHSGPSYSAMRSLASEFDVEIERAAAVTEGLLGRAWFYKDIIEVGPDIARAKAILDVITKDKRWKDGTGIIKRVGVVMFIGTLCRGKSEEDARRLCKRLLRLDMSKSGPIATRYGTSMAAIKKMREYALTAIHEGKV